MVLENGIGSLWRRPSGGEPIEVLWQVGQKSPRIHAKSGRPLTVHFKRVDANPATESVHFPELGILAMLSPRASTPVHVGPRPPGRYEFSSPDGDLHGWLIVDP